MFKIIKDQKTKQLLKKNDIFKQEFVYNAPVIIFCIADPSAFPKDKLEEGYDDPYNIRAIRDISIASQNLVLMATELGLGTCYIGWMHKERIKPILNLAKKYLVPFAITIGYPDKKTRPTKRKKINEIII